ncbi:hypothetical protein QBC43DRAFT_131851 [Cladorrhinum sp. PSN259]|nr:hypothetical protein QBC43DRAFT_131851 [Cladorrhinum sp. PSN259]
MGLRFWKKKPAQGNTTVAVEKTIPGSPQGTIFLHQEKQSAEKIRPHHPPGGVPIRPDVNPAYSAYSTPADPTWADSLTPKYLPPALLEAKLKEEGITDPDEIARRKAEEARKKAEQDEQERMDFLQMM